MGLPDASNVLFCLHYGIGDVVMELPVLETLRRDLPRARITGLGAPPALELLESDPHIDVIASIGRWGLRHWGDNGDPAAKEKIKKWIASEGFDLILDPSHAVFAVRDAIWQSGHSAVLDSESPTPALADGRGGVAAINRTVATGWGLEVPSDLQPRLHLPPAAYDFAAQFLKQNGFPNKGRIAGISPVASSTLKQWPMNRLAIAADFLIEHQNCSILQFCGPHESACRGILRQMRRPGRVISVGPLHLAGVAALLSKCFLFICNDTGLMHMAAALKVPVIAVFGPTSPSLYLPDGARAVTGGRIKCPYLRADSFGPSPCIVENRCLFAEQACIVQAETGQVIGAIQDFMRDSLYSGSE